jgi:hypothetical protein
MDGLVALVGEISNANTIADLLVFKHISVFMHNPIVEASYFILIKKKKTVQTFTFVTLLPSFCTLSTISCPETKTKTRLGNQ